MVLVILVKVLADDEGGGHVDEAGSHTVEQAVGEEQPLETADEGRAQAAGGQDDRANQAAPAVAAVAQRADEGHRHRGAGQRDAERQGPNPV